MGESIKQSRITAGDIGTLVSKEDVNRLGFANLKGELNGSFGDFVLQTDTGIKVTLKVPEIYVEALRQGIILIENPLQILNVSLDESGLYLSNVSGYRTRDLRDISVNSLYSVGQDLYQRTLGKFFSPRIVVSMNGDLYHQKKK